MKQKMLIILALVLGICAIGYAFLPKEKEVEPQEPEQEEIVEKIKVEQPEEEKEDEFVPLEISDDPIEIESPDQFHVEVH